MMMGDNITQSQAGVRHENEQLKQNIAELERERENYLNEALNACRATVEQARADEREQLIQKLVDSGYHDAARVIAPWEGSRALGDE